MSSIETLWYPRNEENTKETIDLDYAERAEMHIYSNIYHEEKKALNKEINHRKLIYTQRMTFFARNSLRSQQQRVS